MKTKFAIVIVGLVACSLAAFAQTTEPAAGASAESPAADVMTNAPAADAVAADAATSAPADAMAEEAAPVGEILLESDLQNEPLTNSPVIPLIVMDDVPLTDAIKNLARQAELNFMLDPKLTYGQPDANGNVVPQPLVSIRWENVTAQQALSALLNNYDLQLVDDPRTGIVRIARRDPAAPPPLITKIIQLNYASPTNILPSVQTAFADPRRSRVVADVRTSQLVVLATERELDAIDAMVARLDTRTQQVLIEARLLETTLNPKTIKGLDWRGTLSAQNLAFGNNLQDNPDQLSVNNTLSQSFPRMLFDTSKGFSPSTAFLDADGLSAVFSFINENAEAKVLAAPTTVTLDNEMARIMVTRASPIITVTPGTVQVSGGTQITYTNLGVILNVTPRISAEKFINLHVEPEVSRIFDTITKVVNDGIYQADQYDVRKLETHVMIPSGNTLVLGGLIQDDQRHSSTKVPFMGDLPLIGRAFRHNEKSRQKSNLLVFITPTIVQESDYQPTKTDFLQTPLPDMEQPDWTVWDDTKPLDWSKPVYDQYNPPRSPKDGGF